MSDVPVRDESADSEIVTFSLCRDSKEFPALFEEIEKLLPKGIVFAILIFFLSGLNVGGKE